MSIDAETVATYVGFGLTIWGMIANEITFRAESRYSDEVYRLRLWALDNGSDPNHFQYTDNRSYTRNFWRIFFFMRPTFPELEDA